MTDRPQPRRVFVVLLGMCLTFAVGVRSKEAVEHGHVHGEAETSRLFTNDDAAVGDVSAAARSWRTPAPEPPLGRHHIRRGGTWQPRVELEAKARALTQQSFNNTEILGPAEAWVMSGVAVHAEQVCRDFDWTDGEGDGCYTYLQYGWCGASWQPYYAVNGTTADAACCGCGGGRRVGICFDHPSWALSCPYWRASAWCEGDGYGPAWNATANGTFDEHLIAGVPVSEGCCGCGRPPASQPPSLVEVLEGYRAGPERVAEIELSWSIGLTGIVPEWIGEFVNLEVLDLAGSSFLEGTLPSSIASLTKLRHLDLSQTGLGGRLPASLWELSSLEQLRLGESFFSGPIPHLLGQLFRLQVLDLGGNSLTGSIPHGISGCVALSHLYLDENVFSGSLPDGIGSLQLLEVADLSDNSLAGPLPDAIAKLASLKFFTVHKNYLTGTLPGSIGALSNISDFWIHHNSMSGALPDVLASLTALGNFIAFDNRFAGTLPVGLLQIAGLRNLFLWGNELTGTIPPEVGQLSDLERLDLYSNKLRGVVPVELFNLPAIVSLGLSSNSDLAGSIPSSINCPLLRSLRAADTKLVGSLPAEIGRLKHLTSLTLENTRLRGAIPGELGNCTALAEINLRSARLTGTLPPELALLTALRFFEVANNALAGTLPKEGGLAWRRLQIFDVASNMLSGTIEATALPYESLVKLSLENNTGLTGALPSLQLAQQMTEVRASRCNFTDLLGFPSTLLYLDVSHNSLLSLPVALYELPLVETLLLNDNFMADWPPKGAYSMDRLDLGICFNPVLDNSFVWPRLRLLDVSQNPLGTHVYMFLQTLFWARSLVEVRAAHCGLYGDVPRLLFRESWGARDCTGLTPFIHGLPSLLRFDLQGNLVTAMLPEPPPILLVAMLDDNRLTHINRAWFNEGITNQVTLQRRFALSTLSLHNNPSLRFEVAPALGQCGLLPVSSKLTTDPQSFEPQWGLDGENAPYECGVPCSPWGMSLEVDPGVPDESSLCRCKDGHGLLPGQCWDAHWRDGAQGLSCSEHLELGHCSSDAEVASVCCGCGGSGGGGNGYNCSQCPQGTYSFSSGVDQHRHRSVCLRCPDNSTTSNGTLLGGATSVCDCQCPRGTYLQGGEKCGKTSLQLLADNVSFTGAERCEACGFLKTTLAVGARTKDACVCDTRGVEGLQEFWDRDELTCGCDNGYFLNRRVPYCEICKEGSDCRWTSIAQRTAVPPLEVGYWAASSWLIGLPADDPAIAAFSGHSTYRCFSRRTCVDDKGTCASGREGIACGLCKPGFYGGPSRSCKRCTSSGLTGPVVVALAVPLVVIFIHAMLSGQKRTRGCFKKLKKFRISTRQLIKHLQLMAVVSGFTIGWPPDVEKVFETFSFTINIGDVLDYACLADQQSASLEIGAQLLLPSIVVVVGVGVTPWAVMLVRQCLLCLGCKRLEKNAHVIWLTSFDAAKAVFWGILLFYTTLLKNGLALLTCNLHPNGEHTVASFPHLHCPWGRSSADEEWLQMLGPTVLYLVVCVGGVLATYMVALRKTSTVMEQSSFQDRGHLAFLFEDFRDSCVHWPIHLLVRDILINIIGPLLNNYGATQLLVTAAICFYMGAKCAKELPYADGSNNVLEIFNALSMLIICMFTAGMGFAREPGLQDMVELTKGTSGSELMLTRGKVLLGLQLFSVFGPLTIIGYQFVMLIPGSERVLPSMIRPLNQTEQDGLRASLVDHFKVPSGEPFHQLIHRMDARELQTLSSFVLGLPASSDILHGHGDDGRPHHHHRESIREFIKSRSGAAAVVAARRMSAQVEVFEV